MQTTAEQASVVREQDNDNNVLHSRMKCFTEKWTTYLTKSEAAEFSADFLLVVQSIHHAASRPARNCLAGHTDSGCGR